MKEQERGTKRKTTITWCRGPEDGMKKETKKKIKGKNKKRKKVPTNTVSVQKRGKSRKKIERGLFLFFLSPFCFSFFWILFQGDHFKLRLIHFANMNITGISAVNVNCQFKNHQCNSSQPLVSKGWKKKEMKREKTNNKQLKKEKETRKQISVEQKKKRKKKVLDKSKTKKRKSRKNKKNSSFLFLFHLFSFLLYILFSLSFLYWFLIRTNTCSN